jgi:AraC-like DNA-binding protein
MAPSQNQKARERPEAPSAVIVADLSDPVAAGETIQVMGQELVHLGPGPFSLRRVLLRLPDLILIYHATESRALSRAQLPEDQMGFGVLGAEAKGLLDGLEIGSGELLVAGPGTQYEVVVEPNYQSVISLMTPAFIEDQMRLRQTERNYGAPAGIEAIQADPTTVSDFFDLGRRVVESAVLFPRLFDSEQTTRMVAQHDIVESLVGIISTGTPRQSTPRDRTRNSYSDVVKSCEVRCLEANAERLSVADLCDVAGVSERTLQYAFQDILGLSPLTFLKRLRLHRARKDLCNSVERRRSVTEIATYWGFWHLGEFSRDYRACFGELPSETLKQRPQL